MDEKLVTIVVPNNEAEHLIIKSLLEEQGILTWSRNEHVQNLFGMGQLGTGYNYVTGPIKIQVNSKDFEKAKIIVSEYLNNNEVTYDYSFNVEDDQYEEIKPDSLKDEIHVKKYLSRSLLFNLLWLFGIGSVLGLYYADMALIKINKLDKTGKEKIYAIFCLVFGILGIFLSVIFYKEWFI